jgi:hypothetical protein
VDEGEARRQLNEQLLTRGDRRASSKEFSKALTDLDIRERWETSPTPENDFAHEAARAIRYHRRLTGDTRSRRRRLNQSEVKTPLSNPEWWEAESHRRLELLAHERALMRQDAGLFVMPPPRNLGRPMTWDEMFMPQGEVLAGTGAYAGLKSVAEIEPLVERLLVKHNTTVWDIFEETKDPDYPFLDMEDIFDDELLIEYPARDWTPEHPHVKAGYFLSLGFTAYKPVKGCLSRLRGRSLWVAFMVGISQAEALVWGLTDVPPTTPWISVSVDRHSWAEKPWSSATIQVASLSASARDVAHAYQLACRERDEKSGQRRRAPRPWPGLVDAFIVRERDLTPNITWAALFAAFAVEHPDHPYTSMRSFRQAFYAQRKKVNK